MDMETIYRLYFRDVYLFLQGLTRSETLAEELRISVRRRSPPDSWMPRLLRTF